MYSYSWKFQFRRHADDHFADEDYASDLQMAQQIACIPPSPSRNVCRIASPLPGFAIVHYF